LAAVERSSAVSDLQALTPERSFHPLLISSPTFVADL